MPLFNPGDALADLRLGNPSSPTYLGEVYESDTSLTSDRSVFRIKAVASASNTRTSQFWGLTALRLEVEDQVGVVDGTDPYLYGLRVRMVPRVGRNNTAIDDAVGIAILNKSKTDLGSTYNGTEALYISGDASSVTKEWNAGIGIETIADNGMYITRGPYAYGILITGSITTAALRIPNDATIVGRNAADSANIVMMKLDSSDRLTLKSDTLVLDASGNVIGNSTTANLQGGGKGMQYRTTDGTTAEVTASADTAASATGSVYAVGRSGSNNVIGRLSGSSGGTVRVGGESGGHSLEIRQAGATRLTLAATVLTVNTDPYDIAVGTTTGTKIGTATTQKLGFWNAAPVVQYSTTGTATGFTAGAGTTATHLSTFTGNSGTKAYTVGDIVLALKTAGIMAPS